MASSLSGRYWLTPDGTLSIFGREHAQLVKIIMLNLQGMEIPRFAPIGEVYKGITPEDAVIHLERGIDPLHVEFLLDQKDPRQWALIEWSWVRTRDSQFNCWVFDQPTLEMIKANKEYWKIQEHLLDRYTDVFMNEESTGLVLKIKADRMIRIDSKAEALKYIAERGGQYRNPRTGRFFRT